MKKRIVLVLVFLGIGVGFMYRQSQQKPTDVFVATDTPQTNTNEQPENTTESTASNSGNTYTIASNSVIGWKGTKANGFHTGTINITNGSVVVENYQVVGGNFTVDMNSIKVLDIQDEEFENKLKNDLFDAQNHPTTTFTITSTSQTNTGSIVNGLLTIKGVTNPISFPANISITDTSVIAKADFAIDRTLWGLNTWAGMVNNFIEFNLNVTRIK